MTDFTPDPLVETITVAEAKVLDALKLNESILTVGEALEKLSSTTKTSVLTVSDSLTKSDSKTKSDAMALNTALKRVTTKVLAEAFTLSDGEAGGFVMYQYYTSRYSNAKGAMDALVVKINAIATTNTIYYADVVSGPGAALFVGVLIYGRA